MHKFYIRTLASSIVVAALAACSGDDDVESTLPPPEPPPPISIVTPNPDRCEILDSSNCMFPWPSNVFTVADGAQATGLRVNMNMLSQPINEAGVQVDPAEWNRNDGFSPSQMIITQIPGLDLAQTGVPGLGDLTQSQQADSPVVVINADTGARHLIFGELDANTNDAAEQTFLIRPMVQFERGARYIVALRNLRDSAGELIAAPEVFAALRDDVTTDNPAIEGRRPDMEGIFTALSNAGIERDELYLAWDFSIASVSNITERVLHIRDSAFASLGNTAPQFTVSEIIDYAPCSGVDGACGNGENADISRQVEGTYVVPNYLDSDDGGPGSSYYYDPADNDELPDRMNGTNDMTARFICRIGRSTVENYANPPLAQARPSLYGHGLLGEAEQVRAGHISDMVNDHQMMYCATDWSGFAAEDVPAAIAALQDWTLLKPVFDRQQQGFLNFMFLGRLLKHDNGFRSDAAFQAGGTPVFDNSNVYYDGNSQGGILGGALMGIAQDVTRGVLGVPGMAYSFLLRRSIDFDLYSAVMSGSYPSIKDQTYLLSMAQMLWDRAESSGYAYHIQDNLLPGTPAHAVLMQVAYGDFQVSMWTAENMARAVGAPIRQPALEAGRHPDSNPYVGIETVPTGDYLGSVLTYWDDGPVGGGAEDGGTAPPPVVNKAPFEPDFGEDPHSLPRYEPNAQQQKSDFLMPDGVGKFVDTCPVGVPCFTDGYAPPG